MKRLYGLVFFSLLFCEQATLALTAEDLDPVHEWRIAALTIRGNKQFSTRELRSELVTKVHPWYALWRPPLPFAPVTFTTDIERLVHFYRARGYYEAKVWYDLEVRDPTDDLLDAQITIHEGEPVKVGQLTLTISDHPALMPELEALRPRLPLSAGAIFSEEGYQQTAAVIQEFFLERHYGRVAVERKAEVILDQREVRLWYTVTVGPPTVFGETRVEGTAQVAPSLVTRELTYKPGDPFSAAALASSRQNILKLELFSAVRFSQEDSPAEPTVIPMRVHVEEKPIREWTLGVGYETEDEFRGQVRWRHNNWFGEGRRLDLQLKLSSITRTIDASFRQPHFLSPANQFSFTVTTLQLDEPGYLLNGTRWQPLVERAFTPTLTGSLAYRVEYDRLNNVAPASIRALSAFERKGMLSGVSLGLLWNTANNPLNPTRGGMVSFAAEEAGGGLGGDFDFYKLQGEADLRVRSEGLNLTFLSLFNKALRDLQGILRMDVRVRGPLAALVPSGDLQVQQAQVQILPLRLALSDINVRAQVAPGGVRVHQLALRSGNGHLTGSGTLSLQRYAITALDFTFATHRLRVINTRQYTAAVSGQLICSGAPQTPFIRGALTVEDVTLRPNLSLLQRGPVTADPTIIVVQNAQELAARTQHAKQQQAEETGLPVPPERTLYQQLGLDLRVTVPRDTWVHVDAGSIELMGQIHVRKDPAADLTLAGSIEAVRGWYAFQGRKFEVEKGQLLFTGGNEIDPGLDIVARYTLPQYTVDLVVGGVASAPTLTRRSDPALEQADILSLLLFGKPAGALNQGEKNTLQTQALQATAGYVAADLRRSVADRLGVDTLEFDMGDNWAQSRIGAGKYVTKDIFVSTSQKLGGKQERNLYNTNPFCW